MPARLSAFAIWALVAAGLVFWGYRLWVPPTLAPAAVRVVSASSGGGADWTRLLGAPPAAVSSAPVAAAQNSRFRLLGVLAPAPASAAAKPSSAGVALIAIDGKPARAYAVGARVDGDTVLQSVARRSATLGPAQGAAGVVLELPPPQPPMTGTLPRAAADGEPARAAPAMPQPVPPPVPMPAAMQPAMPVAQPAMPPAMPVAQPAMPQAAAQPVDEEAAPNRPRRGGGPGPTSR